MYHIEKWTTVHWSYQPLTTATSTDRETNTQNPSHSDVGFCSPHRPNLNAVYPFEIAHMGPAQVFFDIGSVPLCTLYLPKVVPVEVDPFVIMDAISFKNSRKRQHHSLSQ